MHAWLIVLLQNLGMGGSGTSTPATVVPGGIFARSETGRGFDRPDVGRGFVRGETGRAFTPRERP